MLQVTTVNLKAMDDYLRCASYSLRQTFNYLLAQSVSAFLPQERPCILTNPNSQYTQTE
jgi:hypothetical protein